jgi:hypothetical protein
MFYTTIKNQIGYHFQEMCPARDVKILKNAARGTFKGIHKGKLFVSSSVAAQNFIMQR